jgi:TrbC/VIRB2 pilin
MRLLTNFSGQKGRALFMVALIATMHSSAFALGGLDKAAGAAEEIKDGMFALLGIFAGLYLMYLGLMAWTEKKSWSDFGWGVVHVAAVGAAGVLADWAWTAFI